MRVALAWQISSYFGWGVYGLNLALEWAKDPAIEASSSWPLELKQIDVDPLRRRAIKPFIVRSVQKPPRDAIVITALGNDAGSYDIADTRVGAIFFEKPLSSAAVECLKRFDIIIAGSHWNEQVLRGHGLTNVRTILQGVDPTLFHPRPKRGLFPGRFVVFSGGKAEHRKGQDLVVKAFRIFGRKYTDSMLVTAWHSPWPQLADGMDLDLREFGDRVIDLGAVPNASMPPVLRECHAAVFPNRCEGGTNLVAMEAIACGVPTMLSDNSGHRSLLDRSYGNMLPCERDDFGAGEVSVEAIVASLERARDGMLTEYGTIGLENEFPWERTARELKAAISEVGLRREAA